MLLGLPISILATPIMKIRKIMLGHPCLLYRAFVINFVVSHCECTHPPLFPAEPTSLMSLYGLQECFIFLFSIGALKAQKNCSLPVMQHFVNFDLSAFFFVGSIETKSDMLSCFTHQISVYCHNVNIQGQCWNIAVCHNSYLIL